MSITRFANRSLGLTVFRRRDSYRNRGKVSPGRVDVSMFVFRLLRATYLDRHMVNKVVRLLRMTFALRRHGGLGRAVGSGTISYEHVAARNGNKGQSLYNRLGHPPFDRVGTVPGVEYVQQHLT